MLAGIRLFFMMTLIFAVGIGAVASQSEGEESRYEQDYNRIQQIVKISDSAKRAEQLASFYKGRTRMDSKISDYANFYFTQDLKVLMDQRKYALVKKFSQDALSTQPKFAEAWFFYGVTLKNENKLDEAITALAKSYALPSAIQTEAKKQLDLAYRAAHKGSMVGLDKLIKKTKAELGK